LGLFGVNHQRAGQGWERGVNPIADQSADVFGELQVNPHDSDSGDAFFFKLKKPNL
jgi:hypothetical protein